MTDTQGNNRLHGHIAGSFLFLCLALAGWGAFLYELRSATERDRGMAAQLVRLESETGRIASERDQWLAAHGRQQELERELTETRTQIEASRREVTVLTRAQAQDRAELEAARAEVASLTEQLVLANERVTRTGAVAKPKRRFRRGRTR